MDQAPVLMWTPTDKDLSSSQMAEFRDRFGQYADFESFCDASIERKEEFWAQCLKDFGVRYSGTATPIYKKGSEFYSAEWFPSVKLNYAENLMHGMSDEGPVLVGLTERLGFRREWNKAQCAQAVAQLQKILIANGVAHGDRVAAILPNAPETMLAMLAVSGLGAIWSSCSPDFGEQGILDRFQQIEAKFLFVAKETLYNAKVFDLSSKNATVIAKLPSVKAHHSFDTLSLNLETALGVSLSTTELPHFEQLPFAHPLFIMFSSGTTGAPKCIVHGAGGTLLQILKEHKLHCDLRPGEKLLYYTTCGWMMWNWSVTALASGAIVYCFEGSPAAPLPDSLWRIVDAEQIEVFGTSAKFIGACRSQGLQISEHFNFSKLRLVLSTGSPLLPEDFDYFYASIEPEEKSLQLASISGGTDILSCFMLGNPLKPVIRGEIQGRGLGMDVQAYSVRGQPLRDQQGELVCATPFPSMPIGFWNDDNKSRYHKAYFESFAGVWHHGDFITLTRDGGILVHGRSDATLNPGGVRIGTAEIYRQAETHPLVADTLAVGRRTADDEEIVLFVKFKSPDQVLDDALRAELKKRIRDGASPRHVPKEIYAVSEIPYTVSGKKVEIAVKRILQGQDPGNREALANPASLDLYSVFAGGLQAPKGGKSST